jgi:hypothetical protein
MDFGDDPALLSIMAAESGIGEGGLDLWVADWLQEQFLELEDCS